MVTTAELNRRGLRYAVVVDGAATPASLQALDRQGLPYLVEVADGATMASRRALEARGLRYLVPVLVDATPASKASLAAQGLRYAVQVDADILPADRLVLQRQGLACYVEVDSSGNSVSAAAVGGAALLTGEANGFATDFLHPVDAERVAVKTAGTVVSSGTSFFTSGGTSSKWVYDVTGTLVNVAVGTLPLDYDPATHVAKGLLIEPQATNIHSWSNDLSILTANGGTVTVNNQTGPDAAATADTFTEDTATSTHAAYGSAVTVASTDYTYARYIKMGTRRYAMISLSDGTNGAYAVFDLQSGVVGSSAALGSGVLNSASIQACPSGWYRCILSCRNAATTTYYMIAAASAASYTPVDGHGRQSFLGTSSTLFWGHAQLEVGTVATSPIPTVGTTATRAADNYTFLLSTIPALGSEYSFYTRFATPLVASNRYAAAITDGTTNEFAGHRASTNVLLIVTDGGAAVGSISQGTIVANTFISAASRIKLNDCAMSVAGAAAAFDTTVTLPTVTELRFGGAGNSSAALSAFYLAKLAIVPRAWSDAELAVKSAT